VKEKELHHIPREGPAVLVCNHVSFVDAVLIAGSCRRPIRFVMDHNIFKSIVLGWFFKAVKAIPIAPSHQDEGIYTQAFDSISDALKNNELVCIFPEGKITKNGDINTFKNGIEKIIERDPVNVVPIALKGLWGSFFSHKDGTAFSKKPKRFWSKVSILADKPISAENVTAEKLQQVVKKLRGEVC